LSENKKQATCSLILRFFLLSIVTQDCRSIELPDDGERMVGDVDAVDAGYIGDVYPDDVDAIREYT